MQLETFPFSGTNILVLLRLISTQEQQKYFTGSSVFTSGVQQEPAEMSAIMGFIYVHTHLHCAASGALTRGTRSFWKTSLECLHIEAMLRQGDYFGWMTTSCAAAVHKSKREKTSSIYNFTIPSDNSLKINTGNRL